jgi:hypothetical protein
VICVSLQPEHNAPNSAGQCEKDAPLLQVGRWARFKKWASKITIAEAGTLFLTLAIAASTIIYTCVATKTLREIRSSFATCGAFIPSCSSDLGQLVLQWRLQLEV